MWTLVTNIPWIPMVWFALLGTLAATSGQNPVLAEAFGKQSATAPVSRGLDMTLRLQAHLHMSRQPV